MKNTFKLFIFFTLISFTACKVQQLQKQSAKTIEEHELFKQHHIGLYVYDPIKEKAVVSYDADKYFTPASNTKILTLFTSLKTLPDSLVTFEYFSKGDSLIFWGTGEPSFLHPLWEDSDAIYSLQELSENKKLYLAQRPYQETALGFGWAWDDYTYYFSAERSALPIAGNVAHVSMNGSQLNIYPEYFNDEFSANKKGSRLDRAWHKNTFEYNPNKLNNRVREIPYTWDYETARTLIQDQLNSSIELIPYDTSFVEEGKIISVDRDSVLRKMMWDSDNFIAEQLLIHSAHEKLNVLSSNKMIQYVSDSLFQFLESPVKWVDGSGLSRYNLNTPKNFVAILNQLYQDYEEDYLFQFFPIGGKRGTLKNYYKSEKPFIIAKTGTLSNNHALSGYLITDSGKVLIFSFMHNNYLNSSRNIKKGMDDVLRTIKEKY